MKISNEIQKAIIDKSEIDRFGNRIIKLQNSRLDFDSEYVVRGFTSKGLELGEIISEGPEGKNWKTKFAKVEEHIGFIKISVDKYSYRKFIDLC